MKNNTLYTDPQLIWQCKCFFVTSTMAVNSPEPTLSSVISLFVWFSALSDEGVASFKFFIFAVVVFFAFIVVSNRHLGTDGYIVILWGALVCLGGGRSGQVWRILGGVSWWRCGRRWIGGTGYLGWLGHNGRQLSSTLHPPPIRTMGPNLNQKWMESLRSWNLTKCLL